MSMHDTIIKTPLLLGLLTLGSLTLACGGDREPEPEEAREAETVPMAQATTVTGCIQGGTQEGTYVLATDPNPLGASADRTLRGETATYTYLLEGRDLGQYVGRQVTVTGTIEEKDDLEVEDSSEAEGTPTTVDGDTVTPKVEVDTEAVIEMRRLQVNTVQATAGECQAPAPTQSR